MAKIEITGRDQGSIRLLKDLADTAATLNTEITSLQQTMVQFNISGQKTQASLKGVNAAGQEVTSTVRGLQSATTKYTLTIKNNEAAIRKQTLALAAQKNEERELQKAVRAGIEAQNFKRSIQREFSRSEVAARRASPQEAFNLKQAEAAITSLISTQKITAKQSKIIWADVRRSIFSAYSGAKGDAQRVLFGLIQAQRAVGASAKTEMSKVTKSTKIANKAVQDFTLSWRSLGRIVTIQLLRRALFSFTNSIRDSIKEAIELSKRVAELQTISQNAQLTTDQWTVSLVKLSESFGLTILDTTEAAYQTLSNQVAEGAETFEFLAVAAKFSITTLTTATDSVNLLTAALNAFGKDTSEAEQVAATLFKTIELGRIRGSELANTFGRVAVLANQLGVSLEGLETFLAIVTIRGVRTSEAMTQIRGVFTKLLRPTEAMKDLFRDLGVESAEQLFQTRSLVDVFKVLAERTQGSSTELGKLFPRIRGITGAMIGAIASSGEFGEKLEEIREGSENFAIAQKLILESSGKIVEIELQKIKNFFTITFGKSIVDGLAFVNEHLISLSGAVKFLSQAILIGLIPAAGALAIVFGTLALSNPFTAAIIGVALLTSAIIQLSHQAEEAEIAAQKRIQDAIDARVKKVIAIEKRATRSTISEIDARSRIEEKASRDIIGKLNNLADDQADIIKNLNRIIKDDFNDTLSALKDGIREIASEQKDIVKEFENLSKFEIDIAKTIREQIFDESLDRLDNVGDKLLLFQREIQQVEKRINLAVATGDESLFREAVSDLNKLTAERIRLTRDAQKEREKIAGEIVEKEAKLALDAAKLKERQEAALRVRNFKQAENFKRRERDLETKRVREIEKLRARLNDLQNRDIDKFADNFEKQYNAVLDIARAGVAKLQIQQHKKALELAQKESDFRAILKKQEAAQEEFARFKPEALEDAKTPEAIDRFFQKRLNNINSLLSVTRELQGIQESVANAKTIENLETEKAATIIKRAVIIDAKKLDFAAKERKESEKQLKLLRLEVGERRELLLAQVETAKILAAAAASKGAGILTGILFKPELDATPIAEDIKFVKLIESISKTFKEFGQTGIIQDINAVQELIVQLQVAKAEGATLLTQLDVSDAFVKSSVELSNLISGINPLKTNIIEAITELSNTDFAVKRIDASLEDVTAELKKQNEELNRQPALYERINIALSRLHQTLISEQALRQAVSPDAFARGGHVASSDRIPALLSAGEFVVNARSSRKFYSQLVGMNSGFAHGGSITGGSTVNIGDININGFKPSGSTDSQAIAIGKSLRRQIKRGTVRLT